MTETGPFYTDVEAGDIVYYNPMDSITIIHAPTSSVPTLTKMGEITSDLAAFENLPDTVDMRIELQQWADITARRLRSRWLRPKSRIQGGRR
jgi:hypothetical protein